MAQKKPECVVCPKCGLVQEKRPVRNYVCTQCGSMFDPEEDGDWHVDPTMAMQRKEAAWKRNKR